MQAIAKKIIQTDSNLSIYSTCEDDQFDISKIDQCFYEVEKDRKFTIKVIDSGLIYVEMMKSIFDFEKIRTFLNNGKFTIYIDSLNGIMQHYLKSVFIDEFKLSENSLKKYEKIKGVDKTFGSGLAINRVLKEKGINFLEVPENFKFFGNLMDENISFFANDLGFATRGFKEIDQLVPVIFWISILAENMSVQKTLSQHWLKFGRNHYQRLDNDHSYELFQKKTIIQLFKKI